MPEDQGSRTITQLLDRWHAGNEKAANELMELVYSELHEIAARQMRRESAGHTLQPTALVHEVYIRLCGTDVIEWKNRAHFYAVAAQQLRRVLVDHARRGKSEKRGGGAPIFSFLEGDGPAVQIDERLLAIDEALSRLQVLDPRAAQIVELRFFAGLNESEAAAALGLSVSTLKRDWDFAKTWLTSQLS